MFVVVAVFPSQMDACRVTTVRYSQNKKIKITNNNVENARAHTHRSVHARNDHIHKYTWIKHLTRNHRPDFNINLTSLSECLPMQICDFSIETTRFYTLYVVFVCSPVNVCTVMCSETISGRQMSDRRAHTQQVSIDIEQQTTQLNWNWVSTVNLYYLWIIGTLLGPKSLVFVIISNVIQSKIGGNNFMNAISSEKRIHLWKWFICDAMASKWQSQLIHCEANAMKLTKWKHYSDE